MSIVNVEKIINGTPHKRINNSYDLMKENYTETSAQEYFKVYSKEPLICILENSRKIFSEPYYGLDFYKKIMNNLFYCNFKAIETEYLKVSEFIEENLNKMGNEQAKLYEELLKDLSSLAELTKNTRLYSTFIRNNIDDRFEEKLSNLIYQYVNSEDKDDSEIISLFDAIDNPIVFFTYAPYAMSYVYQGNFTDIQNKMFEMSKIPNEEYDDEKWKKFVDTTICCNKLSKDELYNRVIGGINNTDTRTIFKYFMTASVPDTLKDLTERTVSDYEYHESPVFLVNDLFNDMFESAIDKEELDRQKSEIETYKAIAYESMLNIIVTEYQTTDDVNAIAEGYNVSNNSISIEDTFNLVNSLYNESVGYVTEAEEDDDEIDIEDEKDDNTEKDTITKAVVTGKKPQAPSPKNLANKVQMKAMNQEAKQMKKASMRQRKGQDIKNAVKAVTKIPLNVVNDIKKQIRKLDEADSERRKNYMTEPGFRKKAFRNLKLAIMYGTAANVKLSLIPALQICRHFSKEKNIRVRNELARELSTEIKVCEEKINDANAAGDNAEKYRLIRLKDQLNAEMVRTMANSKYV